MKLTIRDAECVTLESQNQRNSTKKGEDSIHETQSIKEELDGDIDDNNNVLLQSQKRNSDIPIRTRNSGLDHTSNEKQKNASMIS